MRPLLAIVLLCLVACGDASSGKSPLACFDEIGEASLQQVVCLDSIGAFSVTDFLSTAMPCGSCSSAPEAKMC